MGQTGQTSSFLQYQLAAEQYTSQLWWYEGFTSYYDDLALLRAGVIDCEQYLATIAKTISRVQRAPSNLVQSLADSSFTAWTKFYQQDENAINSVVSYYAKGSLLALCLDAALRQRGLSLDGLMLQCWQDFGVNGTGSDEQAFFYQLQRYAKDDTLTELCRQWVEQPMALPLSAALQSLGINLHYRAAQSGKDLAEAVRNSFAHQKDFGALYQSQAEGLQISAVMHGSSAYLAGLMAGDLLIAIAGLKATEATFVEMLSRHPVGAKLSLHWFRQQRLLTAELELRTAPLQISAVAIADKTLRSAGCSGQTLAKIAELKSANPA